VLHRLRPLICATLFFLVGTACESPGTPPDRAEASEMVSVSARVVAVDPALRLVTLENDAGEAVTVLCGPEVRNFDQIEVDDVLRVRYRVTLVAARIQPGEATVPTTQMVAARAAEAGAKPAGGIGQAVTTTVRIESIDRKQQLVTFTPPEGGLRTVRVVRPEGQAFVAGLKPGDTVRLTYTEALAISVDED
jgi:hypothetical protein